MKQQSETNTQRDILRMDGILAEGYGINPKAVMRDTRLTLEAKGIYSYLSAFAGAGAGAFPSRELILKELGISKDRYYKHFNLLIEYDYIRVEKIKEGNLYSRNLYIIVSHPEPAVHEKPKTKKPALFSKKTAKPGTLRAQFEIDKIKEQFPDDSSTIENILMAAEDMENSETITVAKATKKKEAIKDILSKLSRDNIIIVLNALKKNKQKIIHPKSYMQTCLVNSIYETNSFDFESQRSFINSKNEERIKQEAETSEETRKKQLYDDYPKLKEKDKEIHNLYSRLARLKLLAGNAKELSKLNNMLDEKLKERDKFLESVNSETCS